MQSFKNRMDVVRFLSFTHKPCCCILNFLKFVLAYNDLIPPPPPPPPPQGIAMNVVMSCVVWYCVVQAMISARLDNNEALPTLLFWIQAIFKVAHFLTDL